MFVADEQLARCFPEDLTTDGVYLYVACGVAGVGVLKYELATKRFAGKLAEGENYSAIWGVAVRKGFLYFTSHCTSDDTSCSPEIQDKASNSFSLLSLFCFISTCLSSGDHWDILLKFLSIFNFAALLIRGGLVHF